jgi:hypothetical protein
LATKLPVHFSLYLAGAGAKASAPAIFFKLAPGVRAPNLKNLRGTLRAASTLQSAQSFLFFSLRRAEVYEYDSGRVQLKTNATGMKLIQ